MVVACVCRLMLAAGAAGMPLWSCSAQLCGQIEELGILPGGGNSAAFGVSGDGAIIVGVSSNPTATQRAWRWERASGLRDLGTMGGMNAIARAVNPDGTIIVGQSINPWGQPHAFSYESCGTMQDLGSVMHPTNYGMSEAFAVSADGSVVVGTTETEVSGQFDAFRWDSATGIRALGLYQGQANGVSADGSVIVGHNGSPPRAFRWTAEDGVTDLGMLPGREYAWATAVSADGSVIVGWARHPSSGLDQAFRWTAETGMVSLGSMAGTAMSAATAVSADGSVVVGYAFNSASSPKAFRWTATTGMQTVGTLGGNRSVGLAVSADGLVVAGSSTLSPSSSTNVAFRWEAKPNVADYNGDNFLEVIDFLDFLDDFAACEQLPVPCGSRGNPDRNGDTLVDVLDFLDFLDAFAEGC